MYDVCTDKMILEIHILCFNYSLNLHCIIAGIVHY